MTHTKLIVVRLGGHETRLQRIQKRHEDINANLKAKDEEMVMNNRKNRTAKR